MEVEMASTIKLWLEDAAALAAMLGLIGTSVCAAGVLG
jgi:hypothetical protein